MSTLRFTTVREIFEAFPSAIDDIHGGPSDEPPLRALDRFAASDTPEDAIALSAYMLGKREAVWWASRCVQRLAPAKGRGDEKALLITEAWVREPEEHRRRAALEAGLGGDRGLPGTWVALAAGWSGGSMLNGAQPGPAPPPQLTAKMARVGVLVALAYVPARDRVPSIKACADECRNLTRSTSGNA
jgi:hypothetical protein